MQILPCYDFPSSSEMENRVHNLQEEMEKVGIDAYVSFSSDNIAYLTNFVNIVHERPFVLIIPKSGTPIFLIPKLEIPHVGSRAVGKIKIVSYSEFPAPVATAWDTRFCQVIGEYKRVGFESICPAYLLQKITTERVCVDLIDELRLVKSEYEIGRLAYNANLVTEAHNRLLNEASVGMTLAEVSSRYQKQVVACAIADNPALNMLATRLISVFHPSSVSHDPHNFSDIGMCMTHGGPHVSVINGTINGYGAEVERTFFLEKAPEAAKRPFEIMLAARRIALEYAVPGELMSTVDRKVIDLFIASGYGENMLHRAGHGMGVTGHEAPFLADGYDRVIVPGMCFTIEPGIYIPGLGGFRHSDTIITTEAGNEILTGGPIEMSELILGC